MARPQSFGEQADVLAPADGSTQMESERAARRTRLNDELNELVARVSRLEVELRQARADERRARAALGNFR